MKRVGVSRRRYAHRVTRAHTTSLSSLAEEPRGTRLLDVAVRRPPRLLSLSPRAPRSFISVRKTLSRARSFGFPTKRCPRARGDSAPSIRPSPAFYAEDRRKTNRRGRRGRPRLPFDEIQDNSPLSLSPPTPSSSSLFVLAVTVARRALQRPSVTLDSILVVGRVAEEDASEELFWSNAEKINFDTLRTYTICDIF